MSENPEFQRRVEQIVAAAGQDPVAQQRARATARAMGAQLSKAGMKRLDDDSLLAMGSIRLKLVTQADTAGCAAMARGEAGSHLLPMLEKLSDEDVNQFFELTYQAMVAELNQSPAAREADVAQIRRILNTIAAGLPQDDGQRLMTNLKNFTAAGDDEVCWTERTLQTEASKLSRPDQIQWLLAQAE